MVEAALHMDETQPDMKPMEGEQDFKIDDLPFNLTNRGLQRRQSNGVTQQIQGRSSAKDDQILDCLKKIMHDQKEQREQIRRIEAVIQSKFLMEEDNIQSLLSNVPLVTHQVATDKQPSHKRRSSTISNSGQVGADEIEFKFQGGYSTQRIGGLGASAGGEVSSDEEDEEEEEEKASEVNWIQQSFKRSTKMDEISDQIAYIGQTKQPLSVHFSAGSVHGNLEGNLKVVQSGLTSFLKALQQKPIERLVVSTGKQKGNFNGQKCVSASARNVLQAERAQGGFLGLGRQPISGNSIILAQALADQSYLQELTIGARLKKIDTEALGRALEQARQIQLQTLQLTNACLSDEAVSSFARFIKTQTLQKLHLAHRTEEIRIFGQEIVADIPAKIRDAPMTEFIKSLQLSAKSQLSSLHLAHLRVNSNLNAEALAALISGQAINLQSIHLEQVFGKKKLFELTFASLNGLACRSTLQDFTCKQSDMTDKQVLHIANSLRSSFPVLKTVVCEGAQEIQDEQLVEVIRQYQHAGRVKFTHKAYQQLYF